MSGLSLPKEPRLKELVLWVTTDCNLCYRYCYASGGDEAEYMGGQVAKQALDLMLSQSDGFKIQFAGGEPLLNMNPIEQVVRYTQGRSIRYQLQTNATLINDKGMSFEQAREEARYRVFGCKPGTYGLGSAMLYTPRTGRTRKTWVRFMWFGVAMPMEERITE